MVLAKKLISGCDVWLNTPTRPLEASGTSGEKAVMNGVLNFSVLDGWWAEGYVHGAGWALKEQITYQDNSMPPTSMPSSRSRLRPPSTVAPKASRWSGPA